MLHLLLKLKSLRAGIAVLIVIAAVGLTRSESLVSDVLASQQAAVVGVTAYGALPDDGKDDTAAIRKAAAALPAGGELKFAPGVYSVSSLTFHGNLKLSGARAVLRANSIQPSLVVLKGSDITLDGLTLDGANKAVQVLTVGAGSKNVAVQNCTIENAAQPQDVNNPLQDATPVGLRIEGDALNITVDSCHIGNIYAIHKTKYWKHKVARGILISPSHSNQGVSRQIKIANSSFYAIGPKDDGDGIVIQGWHEQADLQILGNRFDRNYKRAIKIQTPGALIQGNQIHNPFSGNHAYDTYPGGSDYDMYAAISVYADNVTIDHNQIDGVGSYSAAVDIAASGVTITRNRIANGAKSKLQAADLIRVSSMSTLHDLVITDNELHNGRFAINLVAPVQNIEIKNNPAFNIIGKKE